MRTIIWAPRALEDVEAHIDYINERSPMGADLISDRLGDAVLSLRDMPTGRPGKVPGTYERYVRKASLIIAFELVDTDRLIILRVIHAARDWPDGQWPKED